MRRSQSLARRCGHFLRDYASSMAPGQLRTQWQNKLNGIIDPEQPRFRFDVCRGRRFPVFGCTNVFFISLRLLYDYSMKTSFHSRHHWSKGAALMIVLALVVLFTGIALAYFSRTTTDRQLAQSSHNDTSADLLARSALDIVVSGLKQEIANKHHSNTSQYPAATVTAIDVSIPNLIREVVRNDSYVHLAFQAWLPLSALGR